MADQTHPSRKGDEYRPGPTETANAGPVEFSTEELRGRLEAHARWLETGGTEGMQADLTNAWLPEVDLSGADLRRARLQNANLRKACLSSVDLRDADLRGAVLQEAAGLKVQQLAGADLTDARLDPNILEFEGLAHVAEISKHARGVFLGVVGGCVYAWLALATTSDLALVVNAVSTPLPIIQTEVPIAGFFLAAPVVLLGIYVYLHMYLQRLWRGLARLPAFFPDAFALDEKAYPWLLTSLVRVYMLRLIGNRPPLWWLQVGISVTCAWALVPITVIIFWLRYLPKHDWIGSFALSLLVVIALWTCISMYRISRSTLLGERAHHSRVERLPELAAAVVAALLCGGSSYVSVVAQSPIELVGFRLYADLHGAVLEDAVLAGKNLRAANLRGANLERADLQSVSLRGADLSGASLRAADLTAADLGDADLRSADLWYANLKDAKIRAANLTGANLHYTRFSGADLRGSNLTTVKLLNQSQIDRACGDPATRLPEGLLIETCR